MSCKCPLCENIGKSIVLKDGREFFDCGECRSLYLNPKFYVDKIDEKKRYLTHQNDVYDLNYRKFVSPITNEVKSSFNPEKHLGLDFGSGTGPVISVVLEEADFKIQKFDPYFHPDYSYLEKKFDFICSCEVIEHFHQPFQEFEKLYQLLNTKGKLIMMTDIYRLDGDFNDWYYKNDPTHVFIYRDATFEYIKKTFGFKSLRIDKRLIVLEK